MGFSKGEECVFALAQIDMKEEYDDAKAAFKKVANEGNRFYIAHLVRLELEKLSSYET